MSPRKRTSKIRLGKLALSMLLAVPVTGPWLNYPMMDVLADEVVNYANFHSVEEVRAAAERNIALARENKSATNDLVEESTQASSPSVEIASDALAQMPIENASEAQVSVVEVLLDAPLLPAPAPAVALAPLAHANRLGGELAITLADRTVG